MCIRDSVIYQTAEDGLSDTIKPRLLAANADCSKVLVIDDKDTPLTMRDIRLEKAIAETSAKLVVLDPIQGFLGADEMCIRDRLWVQNRYTEYILTTE